MRTDYGEFLAQHVSQLVVHRYLRREWPKDLAHIMPQLNLGDLLILGQCEQPIVVEDAVALIHAERGRSGTMAVAQGLLRARDMTLDGLDAIPLLDLLGDWYRLRLGSEMALARIPAERLAAYRLLIDLYAGSAAVETGGAQESFARMLRMMDRYLSGLPSRNFAVDLATGALEPRRTNWSVPQTA